MPLEIVAYRCSVKKLSQTWAKFIAKHMRWRCFVLKLKDSKIGTKSIHMCSQIILVWDGRLQLTHDCFTRYTWVSIKFYMFFFCRTWLLCATSSSFKNFCWTDSKNIIHWTQNNILTSKMHLVFANWNRSPILKYALEKEDGTETFKNLYTFIQKIPKFNNLDTFYV